MGFLPVPFHTTEYDVAIFTDEADFVTKEEIFNAYKLFQYAKYAGNEECDECLELCRKDLAQKNLRC